MDAHGTRTPWLFGASAALLLSVAALVWWSSVAWLPLLPYHDSFASGRTEEWHSFGGAWTVLNGAIRNDSDERGAKFITGSANWSDYSVDADILLLGQDGDAGLTVRSTDEDEGVDSYSGYYVGLRDRNNTLTIGRADHGWIEYQAVSPHRPLQSLYWYHLHVVAVGCEIAAVASDPQTGDHTYVFMHEMPCALRGQVGLRSYSSGGEWKNIHVVKAGAQDIASLRALAPPAMLPSFLQTESGFNSVLPSKQGARSSPLDSPTATDAAPQFPLGNLRINSPVGGAAVTVRGSVILTYPHVYLQDSTGGVAVEFAQAPPLKIGDEVEATGVVEPRRFSAVIRNAAGHFLWQGSPAPPLSVTPSQAATGIYDAMFVETEGEVEDRDRSPNGSSELLLRAGHQKFRAILGQREKAATILEPAINSVVRVRGVCVVDPEYTENLTPFAVLMRSNEDMRIVAGPPWWDFHHIVMIAISLPLAGLVGLIIYSRVEHWRLHAVLEERSRMAREIHDTLAQGFAGIAFQLESAMAHTAPGYSALDPIAIALQMAERSRGEAHLSIAALRALHIDAPLEEILKGVLKQQLAGAGLVLNMSTEGNERRLPVEIEANVLRIVQECLANSIQHAQASKVDLQIAYAADRLDVTVRDNGHGFDTSSALGAEHGHFGITGMRERAVRIGAAISLASHGDGTTVSLHVPLPQRSNSNWTLLLAKLRRRLNINAAQTP